MPGQTSREQLAISARAEPYTESGGESVQSRQFGGGFEESFFRVEILLKRDHCSFRKCVQTRISTATAVTRNIGRAGCGLTLRFAWIAHYSD
jgi:hypothetical protein